MPSGQIISALAYDPSIGAYVASVPTIPLNGNGGVRIEIQNTGASSTRYRVEPTSGSTFVIVDGNLVATLVAPWRDPGSFSFGQETGFVPPGATVVFEMAFVPYMAGIHTFSVNVLAEETSDITPPVITEVSADVHSGTQASILWRTDEPADSRVDYGPTPSLGLTEYFSILTTTRDVWLDNLLPGTLYYYVVHSTDAAGNPAASGPFTFTTASAPPGALTITNVQTTFIASSFATITWETNEPADSALIYSELGGGWISGESSTELVTRHFLPLLFLKPGTTYEVELASSRASASLTITTLPAENNIASIDVYLANAFPPGAMPTIWYALLWDPISGQWNTDGSAWRGLNAPCSWANWPADEIRVMGWYWDDARGGYVKIPEFVIGVREYGTTGPYNLVNGVDYILLPTTGELMGNQKLFVGWNVVSYNRPEAKAIELAIASLGSALIRVWVFQDGWKMYDPADPIGSDLTTLFPRD